MDFAKYLDVLNTYMTEIIGAVSILVVIIIYIMIKKAYSKKMANKNKEALSPIELDTQPQNEEYEEQPTTQTQTLMDEQSFQQEIAANIPQQVYEEKPQPIQTQPVQNKPVQSQPIQEKPIQKKPTQSQPKSNIRQKRDVPPHGKIIKDNFKEFAGIRILVAEDNIINQKVIGGLLADTGIDITIADDGQIALDILEKDSNFNFILMDAHMPRVDGFEATRTIRQNSAYDHIVVVALSGDTASDDLKKMREAGMEEQLEKPLKMDALYDILYAYGKASSNSNTPQESDEYIEIVMTKELNGNKGLQICGGDKSFYDEILSEFVSTYSNSANKLTFLLQNKEIQHADRFLLDIVGITANIGADNLHDIAQKLKENIQHSQNIQTGEYLRILKEYEQHLILLLNDIDEHK